MTQAPYSLGELEEAYNLVLEHGTVAKASQATGQMPDAIRRKRNRYIGMAERGEFGTKPVIPGFRLTKTTAVTNEDGDVVREFIQQRPETGPEFQIPEGHVLKGVSALVDGNGREVLKWIKTRVGDLSVERLVELLNESFADLPALPKIEAPKSTSKKELAVYPLIDWHIGLLAWARETGEAWDLKIARKTIMAAQRRLIEATPPADEAIILGIGDMLHVDGYEPVTPKSRHPLDADSRFPKILTTACDMVEETIGLALQRHRLVVVRILPGNHDPVSTLALTLALSRVFRDNKRVTVDDSPAYNWWFRRGKVFLGGSHGDKTKMADLPMAMAHDRPDDWAASTYRRVYTGHLHHERRIEVGGVIVTSMRTPTAKDAYHSFSRWRSGRSVYSETFTVDGTEAATLQFNI